MGPSPCKDDISSENKARRCLISEAWHTRSLSYLYCRLLRCVCKFIPVESNCKIKPIVKCNFVHEYYIFRILLRWLTPVFTNPTYSVCVETCFNVANINQGMPCISVIQWLNHITELFKSRLDGRLQFCLFLMFADTYILLFFSTGNSNTSALIVLQFLKFKNSLNHVKDCTEFGFRIPMEVYIQFFFFCWTGRVENSIGLQWLDCMTNVVCDSHDETSNLTKILLLPFAVSIIE